MKIALVYDRITKWGGAERVLLTLHKIWPDAPIYTAVYNPHNARWAKIIDIRPSFLNRLPFANTHHEVLPFLTPMAFESFSFHGYDVVISITSAEAKAVITGPETLHVCYCLTPTRYLWSGYEQYSSGLYRGIAPWVLSRSIRTLRSWDRVAASRPDKYIAISDLVAGRIRKYYARPVDCVIYPPVDTDAFTPKKVNVPAGGFLVVSRLVGYKRVDLAIEACNRLGLYLTVIGRGHDEKILRKIAGPTIHFVNGTISDGDLAGYYRSASALIHPALEDFGLAAAEAQACGTPVIGYRKSAVAEIIREGETGELFDFQTVDSLAGILKTFNAKAYTTTLCRKQALTYSIRKFTDRIQSCISMWYNANRRGV